MRISDWSSDVCSSDLQIAMDQNGDLSLNLTPETAAAMWKAGLINESQLGAIADGGHARFSFAHNELLVSSGTDFSRSARSDTRSEEHTSELQSLMRISYAVFCLKKKNQKKRDTGNK